MIHPPTIATQSSKTKKESAQDLIEFWKENDIYVKPSDNLNIFLGIGFFSTLLLSETPYGIVFQIGIVTVFILMVVSYWLRKKSNKSSALHESPIEHVRMQKERMIAQRALSMKMIYWGFPLILILKISSFYLYKPDESWFEIILLAGMLLVALIAAIIINRNTFVQPIADADKVLSMED